MAAREGCRGALAPSYEIPAVEVRKVPRLSYLVLAVGVGIAGVARHGDFIRDYGHYRLLMISWLLVFTASAVQWVIALFERPDAGWSPRLDLLTVVVAVPVYNEDPATLDRSLYSLAQQTRPPDIIHVVDDGSTKVSYDHIRDHWMADPVVGPRLRWTRQANGGKKAAQAACFNSHPEADIFVTVDSDTTLARNAIKEGLRPFRHRDVFSVAGLELGYNQNRNWLTLMTCSRTLSWELLSCAAQNVAGGDVTVNRGTYALYRAEMVRDVLPAYLNERFLGHDIKLGDDAALTLFAECRGRAVQQVSAACFTMYPETLRHHFKQWTRWMRGSTVRTCWRLRYLRLTSYSWWFTLISTWSFIISIGASIAVGLTWPKSYTYLASAVIATIAWSALMALRTTTVRRSDQTWLDRAILVIMAPFAAFWVALVLRPLRIYGIATFLRQGWVTRTKVEIATEGAGAPAQELA